MPLDDKQKSFIRHKVKRLGTIEKVRRNYRMEDLVSQYALQVAEEMFGTSKNEVFGAEKQSQSRVDNSF
jgi:hypothetical protein